VASWEERRPWRDEFRSLGVELVRDRLRLGAWHEEKLQEACRWLWWQEHLVIEGAKPQDEVECALVIQMACTHAAAMAVLGRLGGTHGPDRNVAAMASAAARLLRAYATQVEALRRLRNGGSQFVRVEHVHVNEGGQAVIGNVKPAPNSS
jgi:hypothetical protein